MHGWRVIEPGQLQRIERKRTGTPLLSRLPEPTEADIYEMGA